jgi:hypothetical protein
MMAPSQSHRHYKKDDEEDKTDKIVETIDHAVHRRPQFVDASGRQQGL